MITAKEAKKKTFESDRMKEMLKCDISPLDYFYRQMGHYKKW